jgi:hypothetical protein
MDNNNLEYVDENRFNILEHVKENLPGFVLLFFAFFIIYFVDYINRLNTIIYSTSSPIPGLTSAISSTQKNSKRKFKKR